MSAAAARSAGGASLDELVLLAPLLDGARGEQRLGALQIARLIGVEEGIDRPVRPVRDGAAITPGPDIDLAHALLRQRAAELVAQPQRPDPEHRMLAPA